jgi:hypothetical protein
MVLIENLSQVALTELILEVQKNKTHYFDNVGKLKYTQVVTIEYSDTIQFNTELMRK